MDQSLFSWEPDPQSGIRQRFVRANGIDFELAEAGDAGSRKLALCLHGFPELNYSWRFQMPMLVRSTDWQPMCQSLWMTRAFLRPTRSSLTQ